MRDFAKTDTFGRRLSGGGPKAGPETVTQSERIVEPEPIAAPVEPVTCGGDQMVAHRRLLGIEFWLTGVIEKAGIVLGPIQKAEPGAGGGFRILHGGEESGMAIGDMIGDEV